MPYICLNWKSTEMPIGGIFHSLKVNSFKQLFTDIDECLGTHTCTEEGQACENAVPGFTCVCAPGFSGTGSTCTRKTLSRNVTL